MTRRRRHLRTKRAAPRGADDSLLSQLARDEFTRLKTGSIPPPIPPVSAEHPCCRGIGGHEDWCDDTERAAWAAVWSIK